MRIKDISVGDRVIPRAPADREELATWVDEMDAFDGQICTVDAVTGGKNNVVFIVEDGGTWQFSADWLSPATAGGSLAGPGCQCQRDPAPSEQPVDERTEEVGGYDLDAAPLHNPISRPYHYTQGAIEPCDFIMSQGLGFIEGNIVKYVTRWRHHGDEGLQDLRKAREYLNRLIARAGDEE